MADFSSRMPYWLWPGDDRPTKEIDDEIAEELRFHLEMLAEQCEREGMEPASARRRAAERFGDFDRVLRRCRVEKQGEVPMLRRLQAALVCGLLVAVAIVGWQQWVIADRVGGTLLVMNGFSDQLSELKAMLVRLDGPSEPAPSTPDDSAGAASLVVRVVGADGEPIGGAGLVFETANTALDNYNFFEATSDPDGRCVTPLSDTGFRLSRVTAHAPGYTIASTSLNRPFGPRPEVILTLRPGRMTAYRFVLGGDEASQDTLAGALVWPKVGFTALSDIVNPLPIDASGVVETDWFGAGDRAAFFVEGPDLSVAARSVLVGSDANGPIRVDVRSAAYPGGGQF